MTFTFTTNYLTFPDQTQPKGHLIPARACQANWYYYILCHKQRENVGRGPEDQIIVVDVGHEGDVHWMDKQYLQTLTSVALIYRVSREEVLSYWDLVTKEALRQELPAPHPEYMNPKRFIT